MYYYIFFINNMYLFFARHFLIQLSSYFDMFLIVFHFLTILWSFIIGNIFFFVFLSHSLLFSPWSLNVSFPFILFQEYHILSKTLHRKCYQKHEELGQDRIDIWFLESFCGYRLHVLFSFGIVWSFFCSASFQLPIFRTFDRFILQTKVVKILSWDSLFVWNKQITTNPCIVKNIVNSTNSFLLFHW